MKKKWKTAVAAAVAWSLVLAPYSGTAGRAEAAEAEAAEKTEAEAAEKTEAEAAEKTDPETGYTYVVHGERAREGTGAGRAEITGYGGRETELDIPGRIGAYEVDSVGDGAFKGNAEITSVTISEGVTRIGHEAFQGCENLASVSVPATVTDWSDGLSNSYDSSAFKGCTALAEVTLAEGLQVLGQGAFEGCTALEEVAVPSTVKEFHNRTFKGCTALKAIELREGMEEIGHQAFGGCTALEEVEIPSTIKRWALPRASGIMATVHNSSPFIDCTSLKKVTFREGITTLSDFEGLIGCPLVEELDIPASVQKVSYAFAGCTYLKKVTMHDGLETMGVSAFQGCTALAEVRVPETVTTVEENAFKDCTSLEKLVIPAAAASPKGGITAGCTGLKELYLLAPQMKNGYQALSVAPDGKIYCLEASSTYGTYLSGMGTAGRDRVAALPGTGASAEGCMAVYDGQEHEAAEVQGLQEGDEVLYQADGGIPQKDVPKIKEPGSHRIVITVKREQPGEVMKYSLLRVTAQIQKRQHAVSLADVEAEEGQDYALAVQGYGGTGTPAYTYYRDAACTQACGGKPQTAGVYYARAEIPETDHDMAVRSNAAKIIIHGNGTSSGTEPAASEKPGTGPSAAPGTDPSASGKPGTDPPASQKPGTDPSASQRPGASPSPAPSASGKPGTDPGTGPSASQKPGTSPGTAPPAGTKPEQTAGPGKQEAPKVKKTAPKKVKSARKKTLQAQWKKVEGASGYQVQAALDRKFRKGKKNCIIARGKATKKTFTGLKRKKKYHVRVRAYRMHRGKRIYGKWSSVKSARVK